MRVHVVALTLHDPKVNDPKRHSQTAPIPFLSWKLPLTLLNCIHNVKNILLRQQLTIELQGWQRMLDVAVDVRRLRLSGDDNVKNLSSFCALPTISRSFCIEHTCTPPFFEYHVPILVSCHVYTVTVCFTRFLCAHLKAPLFAACTVQPRPVVLGPWTCNRDEEEHRLRNV